ncbi:MAG: zinc-ribbon domain-containing protein, partial [Woeseiaceae bacterium]
MYTQCPECHTAFRVTARVLQQAGGRVRCGGCASAFNALDYLSEDLPQVREDPGQVDQPSDVDTQSRKLLETLDQLAGSENVVIEDTGVEWQVLEDSSDNDEAGEPDISDTGTMRWTLEDVEDDVEAVPEIVDKVPLSTSPDEESVMRFDDNTPLPEDFDDIVTTSTPTPHRRQEDRIELEKRHLDDMQIDLALGEPDEWVDLLDEVDDASQHANREVSLEVEEELAAIHSELTPRPAGAEWATRQAEDDEETTVDHGDDVIEIEDEDDYYGPDVIDSRIEQMQS